MLAPVDLANLLGREVVDADGRMGRDDKSVIGELHVSESEFLFFIAKLPRDSAQLEIPCGCSTHPSATVKSG